MGEGHKSPLVVNAENGQQKKYLLERAAGVATEFWAVNARNFFASRFRGPRLGRGRASYLQAGARNGAPFWTRTSRGRAPLKRVLCCCACPSVLGAVTTWRV